MTSVYLVQKPFFLSHLETAILAPINAPLKLSASWRGAGGLLSVWRMHSGSHAMLIPTLQKHGLSMASLGAVTGWRFTAGAFVQGATGRGSALGHGVLPLNLLKCTEPTRLLEGQSSLKKAIAEMTASTKAGHSLRCFSALDSRGLEGRASPDSLHSAFTKLSRSFCHKK